jgi:muramoyltetrapeptide carboxypeptidase
MAVTPRTRAGLVKFRPVSRGGRLALVAPASPFDRAEFDRGVARLTELGFDVVYDDDVFAEGPIVAGAAERRAAALARACTREDVDAVVAVRGGYGSAETLPWLEAAAFRRARTAFIGYSDVTSVHAFLNCHVRLASVHGAMIAGRIAAGPEGFDAASWLGSLQATPLGELALDGVEVIRQGEALGPLFGGTLTQLVASLGTPHEFLAPPGHILLIDEVGERPYRVRRALTQLSQSGRLSGVAGLIFGQLPRCDEPGGTVTSRQVVAEMFAGFSGPVLFGFPTGHTTTPCVSLPLGVDTRVVARAQPRVVVEEAAAG